MIACAHVTGCKPKNQTTLFISYHVEGMKNTGEEFAFTADADVPASSSATQIALSIKQAVISKSPEFGGSGLQLTEIFVFGAA